MTCEIEWALDYCLTCDKQTSGGAYCCQSCRLADLETSSCGSEPGSPTTPDLPWPSATLSFHLSPGFKFAGHETSKSTSLSASPPTSYFSSHATTDGATGDRILSPSCSRSPLSSDSNKSPQSCPLSAQARTELRGYFNSFDLIRNWRRRMTSP